MVFPVMIFTVATISTAPNSVWSLAIGAYGLSQPYAKMPVGLLSDPTAAKTIILLVFDRIMIIGSLVAAFSDSVWGLIIGRALQGIGAVGSTIMAF